MIDPRTDLLVTRPDLHCELEAIASDELQDLLSGSRTPEALLRLLRYLQDESGEAGMLSRDQLVSTHMREDLTTVDYRAARLTVSRIVRQTRTLIAHLRALDLERISSVDPGHSVTCPVRAHFDHLWSKLLRTDRAKLDLCGYIGAAIEYGPGGDQEAQECTCGLSNDLSSTDQDCVQVGPTDVPTPDQVAHKVPDQGSAVLTPDGPGLVLACETGATDVVRVRLDSSSVSHPGYCYRAQDVEPMPADLIVQPMGFRVRHLFYGDRGTLRGLLRDGRPVVDWDSPSCAAAQEDTQSDDLESIEGLEEPASSHSLPQEVRDRAIAQVAQEVASMPADLLTSGTAGRGRGPDGQGVALDDLAHIEDWARSRMNGNTLDPHEDPTPVQVHRQALSACRTIRAYLEACPLASRDDLSQDLRTESRAVHIFG